MEIMLGKLLLSLFQSNLHWYFNSILKFDSIAIHKCTHICYFVNWVLYDSTCITKSIYHYVCLSMPFGESNDSTCIKFNTKVYAIVFVLGHSERGSLKSLVMCTKTHTELSRMWTVGSLSWESQVMRYAQWLVLMYQNNFYNSHNF